MMKHLRRALPACYVLLLGAMTAVVAHAQATCSLTIHVSGFRNTTGVLGAELFTSSAGWPENVGRSFRHGSFPIEGDHATAHFDHIPAGRYGIAVLHDENKNEKLDRNLFQVPKEGFGFANNPHVLLVAPPFEKAAIAVTCPAATTDIHLIYK